MVFLQYYLYYVLSISSCSLFLMMMNLVLAGPTGLTLKLIHRDSPGSPLYQGNLTKLERMERAYQQSKDPEQQLLSTWNQMKQVSRNNSTTNNSKSDINIVRPPLKGLDEYTYIVELGIGTFPNAGGSPSEPPLIPIYYYFYFDTASDLLWLQCDSSRTGSSRRPVYFLQNQPVYPGQHSFTYRPLLYNDPNRICRKYADDKRVPAEGHGFCGYRVLYADGAGTEGVLATEKLTLSGDNGQLEEIMDFVFGCGYRQNEPDFGKKPQGQNPIVGIIGLGGGEESFIRQIGRQAQYKFEYCLRDDTNSTFLRFGPDVKIFSRTGQAIQTTSIVPIRGETPYYVIMDGISVGGERVVYPQGGNVFAAKQDGTGGCIFDAGASETQFSAEVYGPLRDQLVTYFSRIGVRRVRPRGRWDTYDLCFKIPAPVFDDFPTIVFHYSGANFEIEPDIAFVGDNQMFCSLIRQTDLVNAFSVIHGSRQHINHRILHDVRQKTISWINEDCHIDP